MQSPFPSQLCYKRLNLLWLDWQSCGSIHRSQLSWGRRAIVCTFSSWWTLAHSSLLLCPPQPPTQLFHREYSGSIQCRPSFPTFPHPASCSIAQRHRGPVQGRVGVSFKDLVIMLSVTRGLTLSGSDWSNLYPIVLLKTIEQSSSRYWRPTVAGDTTRYHWEA